MHIHVRLHGPESRDVPRSTGRAATIGSVLTGLAFQPVLIVSGVLVARLLGVEHRGELALLSLLPYALSALGALGVPLALTYFIASQPSTSRELVRRVRPVMIAQLLVLPLVHAVLLWVLIAGSAPTEVVVAGLATLLVVPATLTQQYGLAILQGQHRYGPFNILRLAQAVLYSLGMALAFAAGWRDLPTITGIWVLSNILPAAFTIAYATRHLDGSATGEAASRSAIVRFGLRGLLGYVSPIETFNLDQAVVGFFLSSTALGFYVVGTAFTNLPRFVAQSVGMVGYPNVASQPDDSAALKAVLRFLALGSLLAGGIVVTLEIFAAWLIPLFYGSEFAPAVPITRILLIGAFILSVRRLVSDGLRGMGRPGVGTMGELVGWLFLVPCFLILVPKYGLEGVAWSVTASWAASLAAVSTPVLKMLPVLAGKHSRIEPEARFTVAGWRNRQNRRAVVAAAMGPLAIVIGIAVVAVPPLWVLGIIAVIVVTLLAGTIAKAAKIHPTFETIGEVAAVAAIATVAMNAVRPNPSLTLADVFLLITSVTVVPLGLVRRSTLASVPLWLPLASSLLLITGVLSSLFSTDPASNLAPTIQFAFALGLVPLAIGFAVKTPRMLRFGMTCLLFSSAVSGAVALVDQIAGTGFGPSLTGVEFLGRSAGLSVQPNHLSIAAAMALPIGYSLIVTSRRRLEQIVLSLMMLVAMGGILASGSRAGIVGALAGTGVVLLLSRPGAKQMRGLLVLVAFGALAVTAATAFGWDTVAVALDRLTGAQAVGTSDLSRLLTYRSAFEAFASSPLVGTGFSTIRDAHDLYLQLLQAGGLLALIAFTLFAAGSVRQGVQLSRDNDLPIGLRPLAAGATASILTWLLVGLAQNQIYDRFLYVPCGFLIGITLIAGRFPSPRWRSASDISDLIPAVPSSSISRRLEGDR